MLLLCGAGLLLVVVVGTVLSFRDQHGYQSHSIHHRTIVQYYGHPTTGRTHQSTTVTVLHLITGQHKMAGKLLFDNKFTTNL